MNINSILAFAKKHIVLLIGAPLLLILIILNFRACGLEKWKDRAEQAEAKSEKLEKLLAVADSDYSALKKEVEKRAKEYNSEIAKANEEFIKKQNEAMAAEGKILELDGKAEAAGQDYEKKSKIQGQIIEQFRIDVLALKAQISAKDKEVFSLKAEYAEEHTLRISAEKLNETAKIYIASLEKELEAKDKVILKMAGKSTLQRVEFWGTNILWATLFFLKK